MNSLVIRLDKKHRDALRKRAKEQSKEESEVASEIVAASLDAAYEWDDIKHLAGCVKLPKRPSDSWSEHMRRTSWRK